MILASGARGHEFDSRSAPNLRIHIFRKCVLESKKPVSTKFLNFFWQTEEEKLVTSVCVCLSCPFVGLAYQGKDIVFRFNIQCIIAEGILAPRTLFI